MHARQQSIYITAHVKCSLIVQLVQALFCSLAKGQTQGAIMGGGGGGGGGGYDTGCMHALPRPSSNYSNLG